MKFIKHPVLLAGLAAMLLAACGNNGPAEKSVVVASKDTAATVNGTPISEAMFKVVLDRAGALDTAQARKSILEQLAVQRVAMDEAVKKGLDKDVEIAARLDLVRQSTLATAYVQDYLKTHPVTDEMLKADYDRKIVTQSYGSEYKVRHIMLFTKEDAEKVIAALKKDPGQFPQLARKVSTDKESRENDGNLGWIEPRGKDPDFDAAFVALKKGTFTDKPVQTLYGWHVIMLDDTRAKSPPPFEQLKMSLRSQAEQESLDKMLAGMKSAAKIEIVAKDMPSTPVSAAPPGPSMPVPGGAGPAALVMPPAASAMPAPSKPAGPSAAAPAAAKGN